MQEGAVPAVPAVPLSPLSVPYVRLLGLEVERSSARVVVRSSRSQASFPDDSPALLPGSCTEPGLSWGLPPQGTFSAQGRTDRRFTKKMGKLSVFWTGFYETRWQVGRKTPKREDAQTVFKSCPQRRSEGPSALRLHVPQQTEVHLLSLVSLEPCFLLLNSSA